MHALRLHFSLFQPRRCLCVFFLRFGFISSVLTKQNSPTLRLRTLQPCVVPWGHWVGVKRIGRGLNGVVLRTILFSPHIRMEYSVKRFVHLRRNNKSGEETPFFNMMWRRSRLGRRELRTVGSGPSSRISPLMQRRFGRSLTCGSMRTEAFSLVVVYSSTRR